MVETRTQPPAAEQSMIDPIAVEPREDYRIWLRYSDGAEGEVDLSDLADDGVFSAWENRSCFEAVHVTEYGAIAWSEELELCPDALYMRLTGKSVGAVMPKALEVLGN